MEKNAQEEFDQINDDLAYYSLRATFFSSITNPATRFMYSGIYAGVAIAGCMSVIRGSISVGQLSRFFKLYKPVYESRLMRSQGYHRISEFFSFCDKRFLNY